MMLFYPHIRRRSRRATLFHGNQLAAPHGHRGHQHPPKPPVHDTVSPGRRRPPPPPPLYDETMVQRQTPRGNAMHVLSDPYQTKKPKQTHQPPQRQHTQVTDALNHRKHVPVQQSPRLHHVSRQQQYQPDSLAAEFSEAVNGEQFVSNPRNQLEPHRAIKAPSSRLNTKLSLFPEVEVQKVNSYSSRTIHTEPLPAATGPSESVKGYQNLTIVDVPSANQNVVSLLNEPTTSKTPSKTSKPPHNTIHRQGESSQEFINNEPTLDMASLLGDAMIGPAHDVGTHTHDSIHHAHKNITALPHDKTAAHPHDNTAAHPHDNTAAHPHDNTAAHPHDNTAAHPHDNTAAHPHDNITPHPNTNSATKRGGNVGRGQKPNAVQNKPRRKKGQRQRSGRRWPRPGKRNGGKRLTLPTTNKPSTTSVPSVSSVPGGDLNMQLEGQFMSMFDTWFKGKFQATTDAPSADPLPHGVITGPPVKLKPVIPNPNAAIKGEDLRAKLLRPNGRRAPVKVQNVHRSNSHHPDVKTKPAALNKAALFNEFMLMFKTQMKETLQPSSQPTSITMTTTKTSPTTTTVTQPPAGAIAATTLSPPPQQTDILHQNPEEHPANHTQSNHTQSNHTQSPPEPNAANSGVAEILPTIAPPYVIPEVVTTKAPVVVTTAVPITRPPTTARPSIDPELLADVNEARIYQGLPPLEAYQVDLQGNIKPYYRNLINGGRLPGGNLLSHGMHSFGGANSNAMHGHGMHAGGILAQHDAIHRESGHMLSPALHREIHRLLRQKGRTQRRNLFGIIPNRIPTRAPIDPDLMADIMEAAQARGTASF